MEIKMTYIKTTTTNIRNRARNIVWFNAPYTQNVKINIGKTFLNLIKKHFPKDHRLYKIFNRNTLKLGYMSYMSRLLSNIIAKNYQQKI